MSSSFEYNSVKINFLSHAGFLIEKDNHKILLDPFLEGAPEKNLINPLAKLKIDDMKNVTDILLTHAHIDHAVEAPAISKLSGAKITATPELAAWCQGKGAETNRVSIGGTQKFDWGSAHYRYAMHSNADPDNNPAGDPCSILLNVGGVKIYHLGDTALQLDFKLVAEVYKPDIVLVPICGHFMMDIDEAVIATNWLNPKVVIPMHYNTFPIIQADPFEFKQKVTASNPNIECLVLDPASQI